MEKWAVYFENIPASHRSVILVGGITLFWLIENAFPLFRFSYNKYRHAGLNFFFTVTTIIVNFTLAVILVKTSEWVSEEKIGVLHWLPATPLWVQFLVGILLLDLIGAWLIHWLQHQVKWFWKFHLVHHTDTCVDTTTANRHHPGESVFRFLFTILAIVVSGAPIWVVFAYQSFSVGLSQFNHANIRLPELLDKVLSMVIVTPNMHHIHHHYQQPYTDSNYGNIFSIWDRVFRTFAKVDQRDLVYGVDTHMDPDENNRVGNLLRIPFQKYRTPPSNY